MVLLCSICAILRGSQNLNTSRYCKHSTRGAGSIEFPCSNICNRIKIYMNMFAKVWNFASESISYKSIFLKEKKRKIQTFENWCFVDIFEALWEIKLMIQTFTSNAQKLDSISSWTLSCLSIPEGIMAHPISYGYANQMNDLDASHTFHTGTRDTVL